MSESYSRLYHRFSVEFPDIYSDDRSLATWVRLLLLADASWPMRPPLPRSVREQPLQSLVSVGLVEIVAGDTYRIRGLDAERERRRDTARASASKRWHSDSNATAMPRRDETSTRRDEGDIPPPPAKRGKRSNDTNPRATGSDPRSNGTNPRTTRSSPRQKRQTAKRASVGPNVVAILRAAANGEVAT
jgi:hypothetical protein